MGVYFVVISGFLRVGGAKRWRYCGAFAESGLSV